ncbi:hypothetical protein MW290_18885 [Aquincola tertiaricarbonis]|uniref:Uncharacterized protein n=1 Tax=Aquincola tertiaricarbonis TaxID=391953 RepID=A0ABY4SFS3_AQUTE|nr:hypothetical protein [Aquincola tertiaricarbonis]URI11036.1 hypothetical protein MW290_18885 [Aquincola tertiaricarbonis]
MSEPTKKPPVDLTTALQHLPPPSGLRRRVNDPRSEYERMDDAEHARAEVARSLDQANRVIRWICVPAVAVAFLPELLQGLAR